MGKYPCCSNVGLLRGPWTPGEDSLLVDYIEAHGTDVHWHSLPKKAGLFRSGKSCRQRWLNYLRPGIKRGNITPDEHDLIIRLHTLLGNRWSLIAGRLPGRTDNEIKNYWNTYLSKTLQRKGLDLNTHNKVMEPKLEPKPQSDPTPAKKIRKRKIERGKAPNHDHTRVAVPMQERPKLHKPKPIRVTTTSLKRFYEGNGSGGAVTHGKALEPPFWPSDQNPCDGKLMLMEEDLDRGGVGYKIIGGERADLGVREQGATVHPQPSDQGKLYEEYLQYLITDDDVDDCGSQEVDLDSFVQSLLL